VSRTDLPLYCVWQNGKLVEKTESLMKYPWESNVSFYLGCSFGFEKALQDAHVPVRNIEQQRNVSMFRTNVLCSPVDSFHNNLVVSMRPIPCALLKKTVETTQRLTGAHGAPIHIGDPGIIGIKNVLEPDFGDALDFHDGDVPVFWACGVTALEAVIASGIIAKYLFSILFTLYWYVHAGAKMAFTHSPGCMFICDIPSSDGSQTVYSSSVEVVDLLSPEEIFVASIVATSVAGKIRQLSDCSTQDEMLKAACSLSHSHSVALAVPCLLNEDALEGLTVMLCTLASCSVKTTVFIDAVHYQMLSHIQEWIQSNQMNGVELLVFVKDNLLSAAKYDYVVVICNSDELKLGLPVKQQCIFIGHSEKCGYTTSHLCIKGEPAVVLCALAVSLALLQTCPSHVRYAVRGICEEPVQVKSVKDPFAALKKRPECLDKCLSDVLG
jgi:uncharacterized protein YcsI (UPF0317 family)